MGAVLNMMTLDGKLTKEQVKKAFDTRCEADGYEYGHSYSGSFSEFPGLDFTDCCFETEDEARDYVEQHGEKWEPAVAVRYKLYTIPKSALNHDKKRRELQTQIWNAEAALGHARRKAQINNRSKTPAYVTNAEKKLEAIKAKVQPKIDERTDKIKLIISKAAAKSNKWVWLIGGWCSS